MILCQSPVQPGFKDRTPGVCRWWVVILMISYKGWVRGGDVCKYTKVDHKGWGWWWASLLYILLSSQKSIIFCTVRSLSPSKHYCCHHHLLVVRIIISDDAVDDPNFPRIASDSEDPSHARHCAIAATDAHPDPWPRMIWKPTNRENGWGGGPLGWGALHNQTHIQLI